MRPPWYDRKERLEWQRHWRHSKHHFRGRSVFLRLIATFGLLVLLLLGGVGALTFTLSHFFGGNRQVAMLAWILAIGLTVALPLMALRLAGRAFRRIAVPLADLMAAADAVAEGNLAVRVQPPGRGDFAPLARSFNHMAEELQRADQLRRDLTADVAHELRTPLHIIQGNLEGILDGVYQPTPEHIEATLEETRALARLVDDLRTLSLAEAGQLPLALEPVNAAELVEDVGTSFSGQAEAAGIALHVESAGDAGALTIQADPGRLDQVLGNLMGNALRHTPAGGTITLRAEPLGYSADGAGDGARRVDGPGVRLIVRDTGEGISPEDLPRIFDRFWRGDRSRTHAKGVGSGLGLAIARQLVQAHKGQIRAESEPGRGSTFVIEIPRGANG